MTAVILTWNPTRWEWTDLAEAARRVQDGTEPAQRWSAGGTRYIPIGTRVYLLRQGVEPRGIIASGWTTSEVYPDEHWDEDKAKEGIEAYYVQWDADVLLDPDVTPPLDVRQLPPGPASRANWTPQASGTSISDEAAAQLEEIWSRYAKLGKRAPHTDPDIGKLEGVVRTRMIRHRSRERSLRDAKIREALSQSVDGRLRCEVPGCEFDFEHVYGPVGKGYAQVHHLLPLARAGEPVVTKLADLAVVCANCHAMIHIGGKSRPLAGLLVEK